MRLVGVNDVPKEVDEAELDAELEALGEEQEFEGMGMGGFEFVAVC